MHNAHMKHYMILTLIKVIKSLHQEINNLN